ncbi:MAG: hypothetical protein VKM92_03890 [Cyanobacteriota bacterium]|nr:hypothetical protein [Cyanobacteriota bacterium]
MSFTSKAQGLRLVSAGVAAAAAVVPLAVQANTTINATQLSVSVAPISVSGSTLGGSLTAQGTGITSVAVPTLDSAGALTAGANMAAAANTVFNLDLTARTADTTPVATAMSATVAVPTSNFGYQEGTFSNIGSVAAALAINGTTPAINVGNSIGASATAIFSTTMSSGIAETGVRRVATSTNEQSSFDAERQAAAFKFGGSGLEEVTAGGMITNAARGEAPVIEGYAGGETQTDVAFNVNAYSREGQDTTVINATSTTLEIPAYGQVNAAFGGTTGGAIDPVSINAMTVNSGGAGTSSTLSVIQSMSVFR